MKLAGGWDNIFRFIQSYPGLADESLASVIDDPEALCSYFSVKGIGCELVRAPLVVRGDVDIYVFRGEARVACMPAGDHSDSCRVDALPGSVVVCVVNREKVLVTYR